MEPIKTFQADLENKKVIFREIGLIISLVLIFFIFRLRTYNKDVDVFDRFSQSEVAEEMVPVTFQESKPLPPPPARQTTLITIVENDVEVETDIEINAEADQETVIAEYVPATEQFFEKEDELFAEETIFVVVESMPSFPGGVNEMMRFLHDQIRYPQLARETGIQGKVFVTFVVEKDGSVTDVSILRGIGGGCDEEAIRVVESMPKWIPGKQRNVPVRVRFNLPIKFTLQ